MREANRRVMLLREHGRSSTMPATLPRMKADDLLTGDVREFFQRFR
jgi:hypothetical protein